MTTDPTIQLTDDDEPLDLTGLDFGDGLDVDQLQQDGAQDSSAIMPLADRLARQSAEAQAAVFGRTADIAEAALDDMVDEVVDDLTLAVPDAAIPAAQPVIGQSVLFADLEAERRASAHDLTTRFGVPPFSVLRADAGYWQTRKAEWLALGIQSELGRGEDAISINMDAGQSQAFDESSRKAADQRSNLTGAAALPDYATNGTEYIAPGTSIFDPVLCELIYRWWLPWQLDRPPVVLDPFAGGSVRGIVAGTLGAQYVGLDLSREQLVANATQADAIMGITNPRKPVWLHGDSRDIATIAQTDLDLILEASTGQGRADLVFSCPPYYDLEVYSDDPADLSRADTYDQFLQAYSDIISASLQLLAPDRFAVWVVGEIRDKDGYQRGLVADTIRIFQTHGAQLYNEAVLVTPTGTLALRAPRAMNATRKLARGHQAVLVFWQGRKGPAGWPDVVA
jgi:hypothetical protein